MYNLLGVAILRQGREPSDIREEDRKHFAFTGRRSPSCGLNHLESRLRDELLHVSAFAKSPCHLVERFCEISDFIASRNVELEIEVAGGDVPGSLHQRSNRGR